MTTASAAAASALRLAPFDAAIFDMDGTLLDTEAVFRDIVFDVCTELGFEMTHDVHRSMVGGSHERTQKLLIESYGVAFPYALFDERCRVTMRERSHGGVPVKPGAVEFITELRARGIPTAVATSSRNPHAEHHLTAAGLLHLFETVVTRDDVVNPKPHPEPYLTAARRLGVEPGRCLALEDSHSGVHAAHAAGMQTVMVPDLVSPSDEIHALGVFIMPSLADVHLAAFDHN
ncbi:haloacid dehalogenase superfamily, subfamily IA, variant 3 with third motif having DD or ED [Devosia lucknowensis]|uniref:Haloacid dehalogenase superfamily, subfamily IA, variant 3 with third motif having DD or ED n=1 Tax=Devosia lucknowensis TaxID=1096929 RepID=A0A1Y6GBY5_9HYPH|nr:HAD family phosphatase [Devosia lucknowensis]SMQ85579.1 haloacid dehalogenase superfamily, subfamily IA, variant 3 with third motif having DD or ED [Devosia lucknowensis]